MAGKGRYRPNPDVQCSKVRLAHLSTAATHTFLQRSLDMFAPGLEALSRNNHGYRHGDSALHLERQANGTATRFMFLDVLSKPATADRIELGTQLPDARQRPLGELFQRT